MFGKIGVIGLLNQQAEQLRRRYPDHNLHFLDRDKEKNARVWQEGMSKVIIVTGKTAHEMTHAVPAHKRILGYNSVSAIGRYLDAMRQPILANAARPEVPHTLIQIDPETEIHWSTFFEGLQPGDVLRFEYPAKTDLNRLRQSLSNARSYQAKARQIESKMKHGKSATAGDLFTDVTILSVNGETKRQAEPLAIATPPATIDEPFPPPPVPNAEFEAECRELYRKAVIARMSLPHSSIEQSSADAALTVERYRKQFANGVGA